MKKYSLHLLCILFICLITYEKGALFLINLSNILCIYSMILLIVGFSMLVHNLNFFSLTAYSFKRFVHGIRKKKSDSPFQDYGEYVLSRGKKKYFSWYIGIGILGLFISFVIV